MKKGILTIAITLFVNITFAQHELLRSEMLGFGSKVTEKYISNLSIIDTTIQGNGAVWNFSLLENDINTPDLVLTIADPKSTPYSADFPDATYAFIENNGSTNYRFFNLSTDKMERVGSYVTKLNTYNDPQIEYVFPLTLGTKSNDTWDNTNSTYGGTYDFECVGSGTLTTPGGTFNALMVRVHIEEFYDTDAYLWYSADNGCQLLSYVTGGGFFSSTYGMYARDIKTVTNGIEDIEMIQNITFNNPIDNTLSLNLNSNPGTNYSYTIVNSMGEVVSQETSFTTNSNKESLNINFSDYPSGMFFVKFTANGTANELKTIKVVKK